MSNGKLFGAMVIPEGYYFIARVDDTMFRLIDCINNYTGTITPTEYSTAVKTTDTILGEEETE